MAPKKPAFRHVNDPAAAMGPGIGHAGHAPGFVPHRKKHPMMSAMAAPPGMPAAAPPDPQFGGTAPDPYAQGR